MTETPIPPQKENRELDPQNFASFTDIKPDAETTIHAILGGQSHIRGNELVVKISSNTDDTHFQAGPPPTLHLGDKLLERVNIPNTPQGRDCALFIAAHEAGHVQQMISDPDTFQKYIDFIQEKTKQNTQPPVQHAWSRLWNQMLDIHCNALARCRSARFLRGESKQTPAINYREYHGNTGKTDNYTEKPWSYQYSDYLLRAMMDPQGVVNVVISQEVQDVINRPVTFYGRHYNNLLDFVRQVIYQETCSLKVYSTAFKQVLVPLFEELLQKDQEENQDKMQQQPEEGSSDMFKEPDNGDIEEVQKMLKETNKTAEERQKAKKKENFRKKMEEKKVPPEQIENIWELKQRVEAVADKIKNMWHLLIQEQTLMTRQRQIDQTKGSSVHGSSLARELPKILTGTAGGQPAILRRETLQTETLNASPQRIHIWIAGDMSGSMTSNQERLEMVTDTMYAISSSLGLFIREQQANDSFVPDAYINWLTFGDIVQNLCEISMGPNEDNIAASHQMLDVATQKRDNLGANNADDQALVVPYEKIKQENWGTNPNIVNIAFVITDGGTATVEKSIQAKKLLEKQGAYVIGIQVASAELREIERDSFARVFGQDGIVVEDLENLPTQTSTKLEQTIKKHLQSL